MYIKGVNDGITEEVEEDVYTNSDDVQSSCASHQQCSPASPSAAANSDVTSAPAAAAAGQCSYRTDFCSNRFLL